MKRLTLITLFTALSIGASFAQSTPYTVELSAFNSIVVGGDFDFTLDEGDKYQATITVDEAYKEFVICEVKGQELTVRFDEKKVTKDIENLLKGKSSNAPVFKAVITTPDAVNSLTLKGKSAFTSTKDLSVDSFRANVTENAVLQDLTVSCKLADISTDKKATANLKITADALNVSIAGASTLNLMHSSKTVDVSIAGFCNLNLSGNADKMELGGKGTGKVVLSGSVPKVSYDINGGCNINASDLVCSDATVKMNSVCTLSEAASHSLSVNLTGGATLIFANSPTISIEEIKSSNMKKADSK